MSSPSTHIIARQSFRFRFSSAVEAADVQGEISRLCSDELPARLNTLFDSLAGPEIFIRIPKLELKLQLEAHDPVPSDLGKRLTAEIEEALRKAIAGSSDQPTERKRSQFEALSFYLQSGFVPWWGGSVSETGMAGLLSALDPNDLQQLRNRVLTEAATGEGFRQRLIEILTAAPVSAALLQAWTGLDYSLAEHLLDFLRIAVQESHQAYTEKAFHAILARLMLEREILQVHARSETIRRVLIAALNTGIESGRLRDSIRFTRYIGKLAAANGPEQVLAATWNELLSDASLATKQIREQHTDEPVESAAAAAGPATPEPERPVSEDHRIRVSNAGLVLIAPYLSPLFKARDLIQDGRLRHPAHAIALLRYCVFKDAAYSEQDLVLEKIFCGMELAESPGPLAELNADDIAECESLLTAVIANWPVLKQTSPDGLRQSFLQREGILRQNGTSWNLKVQRQAHDILLDFLPWSYNMLKLPWMQGMMFVDWTK